MSSSFNKDEKNNLKKYLVMCSHMNYGLTKPNVTVYYKLLVAFCKLLLNYFLTISCHKYVVVNK